MANIAIDLSEPTVLILHGNPDWPQPDLEEYTHLVVTFASGTDLAERVRAAATEVETVGYAMHVVASGVDGVVAVRLAVNRPDLVRSVILADCTASNSLGDVTAELPNVTAPALVVAACPDGETGIEESQTLAGQIPNGVFVVMDRIELPAFKSRPESFSAWTNSFISIVEGLRALDSESVTTEPAATPA